MGQGWPTVDVRHEMLEEAVEIIHALFEGGHVTYHGKHHDVESAKLWDVPEPPPPIGIAVSGEQSCALAGHLADLVIATEPKKDLLESFERHGGTGRPSVGQLPVCFDTDRDTAIRRAHDQFRWFGLGWKVNSELPGPESFDQATRFVTEDDVASAIPCGDDPEAIVEAVRPYVDARFAEVALVQIGGPTQPAFIDWSEKTLLPALRDAFT